MHNKLTIVCSTAVAVIFVAILLLIIMTPIRTSTEGMVSIKPVTNPVTWTKNPTCKYKISKTLHTILDKNKLGESAYSDDWTMYLPCTYNHINAEISALKPNDPNQRLFIVNNADQLSSKHSIWSNLVKTYGRDAAISIMPRTYVLSSIKDMLLFGKERTDDTIYIMKKNIQRQKGLKITKSKMDIMKGAFSGYVIAQELLQDPYILNTRKINMRFYLLFICQNNEIAAYVHKDGFMYYTKAPFVKDSVEEEPNITTGYIDRHVYEVNPLTHDDFKKYLDSNNRVLTQAEKAVVRSGYQLSTVIFSKIHDLLRKVVFAVKHTVCQGSHLKPYITFQLFGADIAINDKLEPQLMEVNKGPDMGAKDGRDGDLKRGVMNDVLKTIKVIPDVDNGFIKLIDIEK